MNINQCKTDEDIQEYFKIWEKSLQVKYGFVYGEMDTINRYCRDRQELLEKCGEQMAKIKKSPSIKTTSLEVKDDTKR